MVVRPVLFLLLINAAHACAEPPPVIPREILFGNPRRLNPQLSPDGKWVAYLAPDVKNVLQVWLRPLDRQEEQQLTTEKKRGVQWYFWPYDGEHLIYLQDADGDENYHFFSVNLKSKEVRDLTPFEGASATLVGRDPNVPLQLLVGMNRRDKRWYDVYRINLRTGAVDLDTENPGNVTWWTADAQLQVRAAMAANPDGTRELLTRIAPDMPWKKVLTWKDDEEGRPIGLSADGQTIYLVSSHGANTERLVAVDLLGGKETVLAEDPDFDLWNVRFQPGKRKVIAVAFIRQELEWQALDSGTAADLQAAAKVRGGQLDLVGGDLRDNTWLVSFSTIQGVRYFYAFDRASRSGTLLFSDRPELEKVTLAPMKPISFRARDGLTIRSYLTLPVGSPAKKLPSMLFVHGGPWTRDKLEYNPWVQWLANRGYAVLQVNFRGSAGYGKKFLNAGNREWGGKMHQDLLDGVDWLIQNGIADPKRIGIIGASYGGYATLVGLTFSPDVFAAGVDMFGPSNLVTLSTSHPAYRGPLKGLHFKRVGDPDKDRDFLQSRSPLFFVDRIKAPLLIGQGANDPSVKQTESDQIVAAMRRANKPVEYIVYADEGHDFARSENRLHFCAKAEAFLARHLGGRAEPMVDIKGHRGEER